MAVPEPVEPVKLIVAVLWSDAAALDAASRLMEEMWGPVDFAGADRPFDVTEYYRPEMGSALMRRLLSFQRLVPPESLREAKLRSNEIENALVRDAGRRVNLDVGYLDHSKLVLASAKYAGQKIHLGDGIWADMICRYKAGRYQPFEWTFPDFRDGRYDGDLSAIRRIYLTQLRARNRGSSPL
jgi:hypothetical protein